MIKYGCDVDSTLKNSFYIMVEYRMTHLITLQKWCPPIGADSHPPETHQSKLTPTMAEGQRKLVKSIPSCRTNSFFLPSRGTDIQGQQNTLPFHIKHINILALLLILQHVMYIPTTFISTCDVRYVGMFRFVFHALLIRITQQTLCCISKLTRKHQQKSGLKIQHPLI